MHVDLGGVMRILYKKDTFWSDEKPVWILSDMNRRNMNNRVTTWSLTKSRALLDKAVTRGGRSFWLESMRQFMQQMTSVSDSARKIHTDRHVNRKILLLMYVSG